MSLDEGVLCCHAIIMRANYKLQRLYLTEELQKGEGLKLNPQQAHYIRNVLRMKQGEELLIFNGRDGEWLASIAAIDKKAVVLVCIRQERLQPPPPDLTYCFAPLKHGRLEYMVQKAVEMGASRLVPVKTDYTQIQHLNHDRVEANIIEAAEQCGILNLPCCETLQTLDQLLDCWQSERHLFFCDEAEETQNPLPFLANRTKAPLAILVGPEGGFSDIERSKLRSKPFVTPIPLGPRILRADTAAVAALALIGATLGDWT